ncbi:histone deacetylase complex subunit SAP130-like [Sycon ciliatum]|uniref:histone deacetylase complex subunit SAP130-like n=1 Tax=Sycon ciliatum TaxID=27933 RepID=UPI0020A9C36B|eukprot:scpid69402/ scgid20657/ Histone deacetylase complex subunit SAP130-B; 130 kDa Sin3-associated polypeptide B; Sin3-associated polypeptide p130 B
MASVQVASSSAVPSESAASKESQPCAPDLQRNSLVSDESTANSDTLKLLREQLRSSVSGFPSNGVGTVTKSLSEERCSTPLISHQPPHSYRQVSHSLSAISSPIPRQAASLPCSPRNGLSVMPSLSSGQMTSPVQRMVPLSTAHASSMIPPYTSPADGSSVFTPLNAGAGHSLMSSRSTPATPSLKNTVMNTLLTPLNMAAHAAHIARSGAAETIASPSTSPRPGILRKRGESHSKTTMSAPSSTSSATKLENSLRSLQSLGSISSTSSSPGLEVAAPARKKPRKQNMVTTEDPLASNVPPAESRLGSSSSSGTTPATTPNSVPPPPPLKESIQQFPFRKRMPANFGAGYKPATTGSKASINHFQRSTDVKVKDEKRPSIAELSAQKARLKDLEGWKLTRMISNLDSLEKMEKSKIDVVNGYLDQLPSSKSLDKKASEDLHAVVELLKGNLQRSKVLVEHVRETKQHLEKVLDHRPRVIQLFNKFHKPARGSSSSSSGGNSANSGSGNKRKA